MADGDENCDKGWIKPKIPRADSVEPTLPIDSVAACQNSGKKVAPVTCMTSDFAMQNVLLQLKIPVVSSSNRRISQLKTFILRCHACFKTTRKMESKFCPSCGNNTLIRTTVAVTKDGQTVLYLKKNFQYNNRGTIYPIPTPKGGKNSTDLMLREDQKEYQKAVKNANHQQNRGKKTKDLFDPDRVMLEANSWDLTGERRAPTIGYGRKNVNAMSKRR